MCWLAKLKQRRLYKKAEKLYRLRDTGQQELIAPEILAYLELAKFYDSRRFSKRFPGAALQALEWYRAAGILGDIESQYICGERFLERGKFWDTFQTSIIACKIQQQYATDCYREAFTYLKEAEKNGHARAKRLQGLAYLNGWGVEKNGEHGFQLIVDSIDQEDKWDTAKEILEKMGLNASDFFAKLAAQRAKERRR